ncbi:hypothetical protein ACFX2I_022356 [Malus domestica]
MTDTNYSSTSISAADLETLELLGQGNGGKVYKVRHKQTSSTYALKLVSNHSDPTVRCNLFREIEILRCTDFPHIVRCEAFFEQSLGVIKILMEFMDSGSLEALLKDNGTFSEAKLAHVARQVLSGLKYLHTHNIAHNDIKPANTLVNSNMEVKIADFGISTRTAPAVFLSVLSLTFKSFIEASLQKEVGKRWTAGQLLRHPFLSNLGF